MKKWSLRSCHICLSQEDTPFTLYLYVANDESRAADLSTWRTCCTGLSFMWDLRLRLRFPLSSLRDRGSIPSENGDDDFYLVVFQLLVSALLPILPKVTQRQISTVRLSIREEMEVKQPVVQELWF
ncbi:hypothetical protein U1Q18_017529 [Sarracenia purpurea var. burkii]